MEKLTYSRIKIELTVFAEVILLESTLDIPKSPILTTVLVLFSIMFCVLRSRCSMLREWTCSIATSIWANNCRILWNRTIWNGQGHDMKWPRTRYEMAKNTIWNGQGHDMKWPRTQYEMVKDTIWNDQWHDIPSKSVHIINKQFRKHYRFHEHL